MNNISLQDSELANSFVEGKDAAFSVVNGWVLSIVRNEHWGPSDDRDDVAQEVRRKVFENLRSGKFKYESSLKTYVCRIAKYTCIDYLRTRSSVRTVEIDSVDLPSSDDDPSMDVQNKEEREIFRKIYKHISSECRQLWRMILSEELTYKKIAETLGIAENTVKSRFLRCKDKAIELRKKFTGEENLVTE